MPRFNIPNSASIHAARHFFQGNFFFSKKGKNGILHFNPYWSHMEPYALAMAAAWGAWCRRSGLGIKVENLGSRAKYAARMKLFDQLGVPFNPQVEEHEEAGRFVPISKVTDRNSLRAVIGDISALLHLDEDPETLAAVQYCISELLRNVLEHSSSLDGAFVCAHNFTKKPPHRVSIAVADCGQGIRNHLSVVHPEAAINDKTAISLALRPGITGARPGLYGTPDNAGAGLFITRCIAKGSGGYFLLVSGNAGYRLRRENHPEQQSFLMEDPLNERHDLWEFPHKWHGTVVALEVRTDRIVDFAGYFSWIRDHMPRKEIVRRQIKFT